MCWKFWQRMSLWFIFVNYSAYAKWYMDGCALSLYAAFRKFELHCLSFHYNTIQLKMSNCQCWSFVLDGETYILDLRFIWKCSQALEYWIYWYRIKWYSYMIFEVKIEYSYMMIWTVLMSSNSNGISSPYIRVM